MAPTSILVGALGLGLLAQGGYHEGGAVLMGAGVAAAAIVSMRERPWSREDLRFAPVAAAGLLSLWALVRSIAGADPLAAAGYVAVSAGCAATVAVCRRATEAQRETLVDAVLALGVVVALSGWVGVAWRVEPWALELEGVWRAATTLTYANVAAGLLMTLAAVALARLVADPRSVPMTVAACVLLSGAGATLSRGGAVAGVAGAIALAVLVGPMALARAGVAPVAGAAIALGGLLPSVPASSAGRPGLAALALAAGVGLAVAVARAGLRSGAVVRARAGRRSLALLAVAAVAAMGVALVATDAPSRIADARLELRDPFRAGATEGALAIALDHPLAGAGIGQRAYAWTDGGQQHLTRYAHNEYLQALAELGAIGLALVLAIALAVVRALRRARETAPSAATWTGVVAAFTALGVHSALDFVWHVPAVVLVGALLLGVVAPGSRTQTEGTW